jgi:hypothetical protein
MIVIYAQILQKRFFVPYSLCGHTLSPVFSTNCARHELPIEELFEGFERDPIATPQMRSSLIVAIGQAFMIIFSPTSATARHASTRTVPDDNFQRSTNATVP